MDVGQKIREVREDLGMPGAVLARRVGVAKNTIWRIERGERTPSVALIEKIAHELRTEPSELLKEPTVPLADAPESGRPDAWREVLTDVLGFDPGDISVSDTRDLAKSFERAVEQDERLRAFREKQQAFREKQQAFREKQEKLRARQDERRAAREKSPS